MHPNPEGIIYSVKLGRLYRLLNVAKYLEYLEGYKSALTVAWACPCADQFNHSLLSSGDQSLMCLKRIISMCAYRFKAKKRKL